MSTEPLVKRVTVPVLPERAFEVFTAETSAWWPMFSHSVGAEAARGVRFDGAVGGRITEYGVDGDIAHWGTVSDWDPPKSVSFTWHPGQDPQQASQVTVSFTQVSDGTEVELVHSGWDRRADAGQSRLSYDTGWDYVLGKYVEHSA